MTYPLQNGIVQQTSDGSYQGQARIALGPDGTLYAVVDLGSGQPGVAEYSTKTGTLLRTLIFAPQSGHWATATITALAVDPSNYLYVGYFATAGPPRRRENGVQVYQSLASGSQPPVAAFRAGAHGAVSGLGTYAGELYVTETAGRGISVYESPTSKPVLVRKISWPKIIAPGGLAVDSTGELYVSCSSDVGPYVLAFASSASGLSKPDRQIFLPGSQDGYLPPTGLAIYKQHLFVGEGLLVEVNKLIGGHTQPEAIVQGAGAIGVALGP